MPELLRKDVDSLTRKLEGFAKELPDQEQQVLNWLMARAKHTPDAELSDAELESASGGVADSLGFGPGPLDGVTVSWNKSIGKEAG